MSTEFTPIPALTELSAPFWAAGLDGTLRLQRCSACGHIRFPLDAICPRCLSSEHEWEAMSGRGSVQTFIRFHRAYDPSWEDRVPYVVALIELEEGPVLISNVIGDGGLDVKVSDPVEVVYERISGDAALPQFRLAKGK
jgi:uncharacterized OB-fold protein